MAVGETAADKDLSWPELTLLAALSKDFTLEQLTIPCNNSRRLSYKYVISMSGSLAGTDT